MTGKESPADESQNKHPLPGLRCWGRVMLPYCMASRSGLRDQIIDRQLFVIFLSVWVSKQICSHCHERSSGLGGACFQSTPLGCNSKSLQRVHQLKGNGVRPWCDLCWVNRTRRGLCIPAPAPMLFCTSRAERASPHVVAYDLVTLKVTSPMESLKAEGCLPTLLLLGHCCHQAQCFPGAHLGATMQYFGSRTRPITQ